MVRAPETPESHSLVADLGTAWHDPERLHALIIQALDRGWAEEVVGAAYRLREIDAESKHSTNLLSLVLRTCADHAGAERVLNEHLHLHGPDALVLFNLAPLAAWRGDGAGVMRALDGALRCDPNLPEALDWGFRYLQRQEGTAAALAWLQEHVRESWRARTMLGQHALARGDLEYALELFGSACDLAPHDPGPLTTASEALADDRKPTHLVDFVLRRWRGSHGPVPLILAIEANLNLGRAGDAALGVSRLRGVTIPPKLREHVAELESRVIAARREAGL